MKHKLLVKLILFFSIFVLVTTGKSSSFNKDDYSVIKQSLSPDEIKSFEYEKIKKEYDPNSDIMVKEHIESFLKGAQNNPYLSNTHKEIIKYFEEKGVTLDKEQIAKFYYKDWQCTKKYEDADGVYVFVSLGLPKDYLKKLIDEAYQLRKQHKMNIQLIIQGFVNDSLKDTAVAIFKLMDGQPDKAMFDINPDLFIEYDVKKVPYFVWKKDKKIVTAFGAVSIEHFLNRVEREGEEDIGKIGHTYDILEKNFYDLVAEKQKIVERKMQELAKRAIDNAFFVKEYDIKPAKTTRSYIIDPSYTLQQDIVHPLTGEVLIAKGYKVDPTQYAPFPTTIVINAERKEEINYLLKNINEFEIILIAYGHIGNFMRKHQIRAYKLTPDIKQKFNITKTPTIIKQHQNLLKVTELAVK